MRAGAGTTVGAALAVVLLCGACSSPGDDLPAVPAAGETMGEAELADAAVDLVEERDAALAGGDREAFMATVDDDELGFTATQQRWFDNLAAMPVTDLALAPAGDPEARTDGDVELPVDFTMRLDGFERRSVTQRLTYTVRQGDDGGAVLVADRDADRDKKAGWLPDPWDVTAVEVRESGSILALFDEETSPYADAVMEDLEASQRTVLAAVPGWSGQLVAYDISDLTALEERTPMELWETGGVAYPVPVRESSSKVAAYRFIVNPEVVHNGLQRDSLLRHELTHVALAERDDASPRWLVEGAAEYVSRSEQTVEEQRALAAYIARYVGITDPVLVDDPAAFYSSPDVNYEMAAIACSFLADTRGPEVLWALMDDFTADRSQPGALSSARVDEVVRREVGLDTDQLAQLALAWALG
ncbi:hypothetical protein C7S10_10815 [Nocardioides currus]|uniref:Peptidase MA-like domain-containing protein n=2 Tax=Nocardioides currus TaxID=2133958 RepID=A0A2R7YWW3_9ACTN|nr:hypothetical protein C7S10_10815 [Nocardioides currus]